MPAIRRFTSRVLPMVLTAVTACAQPDSILLPPNDKTRPDSLPWSGVPGLGELLKSMQDATWAYHDESVARASGYSPAGSGCEYTSLGSMGHRYVNPSLIGLVPGSQPMTGTDTVIDPLRPEALLYEPQEVGSPQLVGVVYLTYRDAWEAMHSEPPTFFGTPFDEKFGAEARGQADFFEFTVWLWRYNPVGMFSPWNPLVNC